MAVVKNFTVSPGSEVWDILYTADPAKTFNIEEISVSFPVSTMYQLRVYFYVGELLILPSEPSFPIVGENITISFKNPFRVLSGESLRVRMVNASTTETRTCIIKVEGTVE